MIPLSKAAYLVHILEQHGLTLDRIVRVLTVFAADIKDPGKSFLSLLADIEAAISEGTV